MPLLVGLLLKTGLTQRAAGIAAWVVIALGAVLVLGGTYEVGHWRGDDAGAARVQAKWDKDTAQRQKDYDALVAKTRLAEQDANTKIAAARQERDNAKQARAAVERQLADIVRSRPKRPAAVPGTNPSPTTFQAGTFGTGAFLFADDSAVLAREAARADDIRDALVECYAWHDAVMHALGADDAPAP